MAPEPERLATRLAGQEPGADDEFVRVFSPRVLAVLRARLRDPEAAGEVADDVLLAVLDAVRAGRLLDPARLAAFVMGTARNLANSYWRRCARHKSEQPLESDLAAAETADVEALERRRRVFEQAQFLDEVDRSIVGLTLAQGLKPAEIACALRMSPVVVRTRKCRAIRWLALQLRTAH